MSSIAIACVVLAGCGARGNTIAITAPRAASATAASHDLAVYAGSRIGKRYRIIAFVAADALSVDDAMGELRARAAQVGADAVVALEIDFDGYRIATRGAAVAFL